MQMVKLQLWEEKVVDKVIYINPAHVIGVSATGLYKSEIVLSSGVTVKIASAADWVADQLSKGLRSYA